MSINTDETRYDTCPICLSSINPWRSKFVGNNVYQIDRCTSCGFAFVNPRPSLSFLMYFYTESGHGNNTEKSDDDLDSIVSVQKREIKYPNSTIDARRMIKKIGVLLQQDSKRTFLDVGCGYGFFSKEAIECGFNVIPLELANTERTIAYDLLGVRPLDSSFEDFEFGPSSFSVVLMSQILEHAVDINLWVKKAHDLLETNGILAIALPNFASVFRLILQENEPYISPPAHLNFFNPRSLSKLLIKHGFEIETIQQVSRIPTQVFEKRTPKFATPMLPVVNGISHFMLKGLDLLCLGMMINIYARKVKG